MEVDGGDGGKATRAPRDGALPRRTHAQRLRPPRAATPAPRYPQSDIAARHARRRLPGGAPDGGDEEAVEMMRVRVGGGALVPRPRCSIAVVAEARVWSWGRSVVGRRGVRAALIRCKRGATSFATQCVPPRSGQGAGNTWTASPSDCSTFSALRGGRTPRGAQGFTCGIRAATRVPQISDAAVLLCVLARFGASSCRSSLGSCRAAKGRRAAARGLGWCDSARLVARRSER